MRVRWLTSLLLAVIAAVGLIASAPSSAEAAIRCPTRLTKVSGWDFTRTGARLSCIGDSAYSLSGLAYVGEPRVVLYMGSKVSRERYDKALLHELVHVVEWRTTNTQRVRLYSYLGVRTNGVGWITSDARAVGDGVPLSMYYWRRDPHERLAESVVNCRLGSPTFSGMSLVPRAKCPAFLAEFGRSIR